MRGQQNVIKCVRLESALEGENVPKCIVGFTDKNGI